MPISSINHLYLVIKNFDQNINFYQQLFKLVGFLQTYKSDEYNFVCFTDKSNLTIGILEEGEENKHLVFDRELV